MLVAIFRARPSPFYVMDEVEAALDDTNLRRLLGLFEQLRAQSQLIVITHQKPTMEIADALYGVTMQGDGITAVISQRMRGEELVSSAQAGSRRFLRRRLLPGRPHHQADVTVIVPFGQLTVVSQVEPVGQAGNHSDASFTLPTGPR